MTLRRRQLRSRWLHCTSHQTYLIFLHRIQVKCPTITWHGIIKYKGSFNKLFISNDQIIDRRSATSSQRDSWTLRIKIKRTRDNVSLGTRATSHTYSFQSLETWCLCPVFLSLHSSFIFMNTRISPGKIWNNTLPIFEAREKEPMYTRGSKPTKIVGLIALQIFNRRWNH